MSVLLSLEGSRKLYGTSPEAMIRSSGPVQKYPDAESLVRSFGASSAIGAVAASEIAARMLARQRIAEGNHDTEFSRPMLRRRRQYPGQLWRCGRS